MALGEASLRVMVRATDLCHEKPDGSQADKKLSAHIINTPRPCIQFQLPARFHDQHLPTISRGLPACCAEVENAMKSAYLI